ncbi:LysR family transcriptional regulator [Arsenicicoccus sp. oral taxon 190]|uniref:LysR family transcriptional regulator n=1 Tax=Arsenicicoccus sp. oral taxon 190 TaxID=1658671 RepID=UPI000679EAA6|nr:LysR family transcriptional regulator [Arsenicicoccus sp. oral taxon 190]AKT52168.1 hypothetical protein ADJ73_14400 [Arsenicicoccus sp. oral taxon 190]
MTGGVMPDLRTLALLVAVGDEGSLGAGARAIGMAQPNASRLVARLERDLQQRVLVRRPHGAELTPTGLMLVEHARGILAATGRLEEAIAALQADTIPELRIAASLTVAEHLAPGWLSELRRHHPRLLAGMTVANSTVVVDQVRRGVVELGFVEGPDAPTGLRSAVVARDELALVVGTDHPWMDRRSPVTATELAATPLVTREPGSGTRDALDAALAPLLPSRPALELSSNAAVRAAAITGTAPAVLSRLAVADAVADGHLAIVPVTGFRLERRLRAVCRSGPLRGPAADLVAIAARTGRAALP